MESLTLTGITKKGKQRVQQFGATWYVMRRSDTVFFSLEPGPWLLVAPPGCDELSDGSRWVRLYGDVDFVVAPSV